MTKIAIIDHDTHSLYIEDIPDDILEKYNGSEQAYIDDNYDVENYSWDYIVDALYYNNEGDYEEIKMPTI